VDMMIWDIMGEKGFRELLKDEVMILYGDKEITEASRAFEAPYFYTSAKTGENVENLFKRLGTMVLQREGIAVAS